jgi:type I restriction and modification enzyme subunit R-like protein
MTTVPSRVADRIAKGIKRFQPVLTNSKTRDDGEADTVMIVTDMLAEVFGYDKYSEITAEYSIRGTYCDLATKIDGQLQALIEVKAIGIELKDQHVKQAVDYASNQGVDWVILTNGVIWRIYKVIFGKPIDQELVVDFDFCALNVREEGDLAKVYLLCREGWVKSVLGDYHTQKQALSRFFLGAMVLSQPVLDVIRRELRRVSPDVRIDTEEIQKVLAAEVIKREVMEGDKADEARRKIARAASKSLRKSAKDEGEEETDSEPGNGEAAPT